MITSRPECSEASLRHVSGLEPLDDLSTGRRSLNARMQDQHFALLPPVRSFCLPAFLVPLNWFMARLLYLPAALVLLSYVAAFALFEPRYGWLAVAAVHLVSSWFAHPLRLRKIMTDIALVPPDVTTPDLAARRIAWSRAGNRLGLAILPGCLVASAMVGLLRVFGAKFPAGSSAEGLPCRRSFSGWGDYCHRAVCALADLCAATVPDRAWRACCCRLPWAWRGCRWRCGILEYAGDYSYHRLHSRENRGGVRHLGDSLTGGRRREARSAGVHRHAPIHQPPTTGRPAAGTVGRSRLWHDGKPAICRL